MVSEHRMFEGNIKFGYFSRIPSPKAPSVLKICNMVEVLLLHMELLRVKNKQSMDEKEHFRNNWHVQ